MFFNTVGGGGGKAEGDLARAGVGVVEFISLTVYSPLIVKREPVPVGIIPC
jgi:hypothetical protein